MILTAISLLCVALPAAQEPPAAPEKPESTRVAFGRLAQYWVPRFKGDLRVDAATPGTTIRFVDDLNMPDRAAIPMFSGGDIGLSIHQALMDKTDLLFVAEYWTHQWSGFEILRSSETYLDRPFAAGTPVESRLTLSVLTLDVTGVFRDGPYRAGLSLSLQGSAARLRMDSATPSAKDTIRDAGWGGGVFFDYRPTPHLFIGVSAKGFTSVQWAMESGTGDFRGYAGVEWGSLRLEGGYRVWLHDLDVPEHTLRYLLYGPYASLGLVIRF